MQSITTVTQKGQVTIPKEIRERVGIKPNSKAYVEFKDGAVKITSTYDILDLAGKFKPKPGKSVLESREAFEKSFKP